MSYLKLFQAGFVDCADASESIQTSPDWRKMTDWIGNLQTKALTLRKLLERYAPCDSDVKEAYEWLQPLLNAVDVGKVNCPTKFPFGWIFFKGENNLPAYPDLCGAAAEFADALEAS